MDSAKPRSLLRSGSKRSNSQMNQSTDESSSSRPPMRTSPLSLSTLPLAKNDHSTQPSSSALFILSLTWQGPRPGYYFGTSDQGTGYYWDHLRQENHSPTLALPPPSLENGHAAASLVDQGQPDPKKKSPLVKFAEDRNETRLIPASASLSDHTAAEEERAALMLQEAERQAALSAVKVLDLTPEGLESAAKTLLKAMENNLMQRVVFRDMPHKYMDGEVALYEHLVSFKALAANAAELYPLLLSSSSNPSARSLKPRLQLDDPPKDPEEKASPEILPTLIQLLMHDNTDLVSTVISVFLEWMDPTLLDQDDPTQNALLMESMAPLVEALVRDAADLLLANLSRLSESSSDGDHDGNDEVGKGTEDILSLIENMVEIDAIIRAWKGDDDALGLEKRSVAAQLCHRPDASLLSWLFQQVQMGGALSLRCLEILALLSPREEIYDPDMPWSRLPRYRSMLEEGTSAVPNGHRGHDQEVSANFIDGIEILLQLVANYRKKQPENDQAVDGLENAGIVMASALTYSAKNLESFLNAQGVELVIRCLKERVHAGGVTLKWLDFNGPDRVCRQACERLVEAGGLKYLFPLFMAKNLPIQAPAVSTSKKAKRNWLHSIETTTVRILYALVRHLQEDSPNDAKERLLGKFVDRDKCDRLVELCLKYEQRTRLAEYKFFKSEVDEALPENVDLDLAAMEAKLEVGGDVYHRLCAIAGFCCVGSKQCHQRILVQLHLKQTGMGLLKEGIREFISALEDPDQKKQLERFAQEL